MSFISHVEVKDHGSQRLQWSFRNTLWVLALIYMLSCYQEVLAYTCADAQSSLGSLGLRVSTALRPGRGQIGSCVVLHTAALTLETSGADASQKQMLGTELKRQPALVTHDDATRLTLMLDLDHTCLFGNDGNDLGCALQLMGKDEAHGAEHPRMLAELYRRLINPRLRPTYDAYKARGKDITVVIYTRRPSLLKYRSLLDGAPVSLRYADDWHLAGRDQVAFPASVASSRDILASYTGAPLSDDDRQDVTWALDRLLAVSFAF